MFNIKNELEAHGKLVIVKDTSNPDLKVIKYHNRAFYENLWDDFLRECRGLVVDKDFNIVSYPFTKIHNFRREAGAPEWENDKEVSVVRKVNGFMVACSTYNGELIVSTTGSIDSEFATLARKHITPKLENFINNVINAKMGVIPNYTVMFECVDESDPHIIHEEPGLYFLGMRENIFGSHIQFNPNHAYWNNLGVHTLPVEYKTVGEVEAELKVCEHEGFVMYDNEDDVQTATKWKSPHYLIKKLFMRGNIDKLFAKDIRQTIDEEYYDLLTEIELHREEFTALPEMERRAWIEMLLSK